MMQAAGASARNTRRLVFWSFPVMTMPRVQYESLAVSDDDKAQEQLKKRLRHNRVKNILFHSLVVFAIMLAGFKGLKAYVRSTAQWLHKQPCSGLQRNYSTKLPSHYLLPSGHRIPSVALGMGAAGYPRSVC